MSDEIIKVLDDLSEKFGFAIEWSSENVMPYLEQLADSIVKYEMTTSILWLVLNSIALLCYAIFVGCIVKAITKKKETLFVNEYSDGYRTTNEADALLIVGGFASFIVIIIVIFQVLDIIKCCTIPELVVLDYINNYVANI